MEDVEFHFALEGISGTGRNFLQERIKEAKMFMNAKTIDSAQTNDISPESMKEIISSQLLK